MVDVAVGLDGVVRYFDRVAAVDGISLHVQPGEVFGILGHNGAGKTTLLRLINGLLRPHEGTIRVLGLDPLADGARVRARTGVLTEYPALDHFLTCAENLQVYASIHGLSPRDAVRATHDVLSALDLSDRANVPSHELSAGLKQRVALARALVHDPEVLLLDEPTSNLDPMAGRAVRTLVGRMAREEKRTVILSTHNLAEAQAMCDRIAILREGRLLACGTVAELGGRTARAAVTVAVNAADHSAAGRILSSDLGLTPVAVTGDWGWEVALDQVDIPRLVTTLVHQGIGIRAVIPQHPTLEDIYVDFHRTTAAFSAFRGSA